MSVSINLILRDIYKQIIYHVTWQGIGVLPKQTFVCTIDGYILSKLESIDLEVCVGRENLRSFSYWYANECASSKYANASKHLVYRNSIIYV